MGDIIVYVVIAIVVLFLLTSAIKVIYQYEAGVVFRLDRKSVV